MTMKNFHVWINSGLMLVVAFFLSKNFERAEIDHEKIANHETRITVLETNGKKQEQTSLLQLSPAMLPDNKTHVKKYEDNKESI
jgi:hypothetical protein